MDLTKSVTLDREDGTQVTFHVGDRVVANCNSEYFTIGDTGTVVAVDNDELYRVGVRFDEEHGRLHSLHGRCESHHGRWFFSFRRATEESECISALDFFEDSDEVELSEFNKDEYIRLMFGGKVVTNEE